MGVWRRCISNYPVLLWQLHNIHERLQASSVQLGSYIVALSVQLGQLDRRRFSTATTGGGGQIPQKAKDMATGGWGIEVGVLDGSP